MDEQQESFYETVYRTSRPRPAYKRDWFWISAIEKESNRLVVLGPYDTEDEANQVGFGAKLDGMFEVHHLMTRDKARATSEIKHKRFEFTKNLAEAIKRARHKVNKDGEHGR